MTQSHYRLHGADGAMRILHLAGREDWALRELLTAADHGCTLIDKAGPRWSDYVFKLQKRGLDIETVPEHHDGPFAGNHARYILRSRVVRLFDLQAAA